MKTEPQKIDTSVSPEKAPVAPKEPSGDAFPAEKDVSAVPPGSDESEHEDKKR